MKRLRNKKGLLEALVVIGLILLIPLFFTMRTTAEQNTAPNTPAPPLPTVAVNAPAPKQPPACTFPLAQTTTDETPPENYTFSEPQAVAMSPSSSNYLNLYQWLPDNQRVLIGQESNTDHSQSIDVLNSQTGEIQNYGNRVHAFTAPPVWVQGLNAVVYPNTFSTDPIIRANANGIPNIPPSSNYRRQLWVNRGNLADVQPIEDAQVTVANDRLSTVGSLFTATVNPDGSQIVYMDDASGHLQVRKITQGLLEVAPAPSFDRTNWDYRRPGHMNYRPVSFQMTWRPNSNQIFLYNDTGYTLLLDVQSGQICEPNLFGTENPNDWRKSWAMLAHWSPNGRYLAVVRTKGPFPLDFSDLIVLDTATGNLYQTDATKFSPSDLDVQGKHYISDVAWAPDNRHLVAIRYVNPVRGNSIPAGTDRLFLLDFLTGKAVQISSAELGPNFDGTSKLLWSNDGSQLIVQCPISGLCLLSVQKGIQP